MEILCTRPNCPHPQNFFADLDEPSRLKTVQQKYCTSCGMPLILAGRYLPSRLLGKGGFGAAFLALDRYTPTMRQCVVKQFQPAGNLGPKELTIAQGLFEREATVLEQIGSKNSQIPDLFAFFPLIVPNQERTNEEQFFYLVQEFIDGQDLEAELAARGAFSEEEVTHVFKEVLKILEFVHENGTIHRDIKPSNIMRDRYGVIFLLDFGAVKEVTSGPNNQGRSTAIYSMDFAPPEQMSGATVYPSTDLYALAATCLNLLTGQPRDVLYDVYNNRWNWRSYAPQTSKQLADIFDRMLLAAPVERFQSAREVLDLLTIKTQPTPIPHPSVAPASPSPAPAKVKQGRSIIELLGNAAFTGFEGALLFFALSSSSVFPSRGLYMGVLGAIIGILIYSQYKRWLEKIDLVIFAAITLAVVLFVPMLRGQLTVQYVAFFSILSAAGAVAITTIFRLIYLLLSRLL